MLFRLVYSKSRLQGIPLTYTQGKVSRKSTQKSFYLEECAYRSSNVTANSSVLIFAPLTNYSMYKNIAIAAVSSLFVVLPFLAQADTFNRQLETGMNGTDVSTLQTFLAEDPTMYPQGLVTGYFGFLTKSAVANFQSRNNLPSVGRVGPATLPVLNFQFANGMNGGVDRSAPLITGVNVSATYTSAVLSWNTNEAARGKVFYSTSPIALRNTTDTTGIDGVEPTISGTMASYDGVARTTQVVSIGGLLPNTYYYYVIESFDAATNVSITLPASFRTN